MVAFAPAIECRHYGSNPDRHQEILALFRDEPWSMKVCLGQRNEFTTTFELAM
jgi:hypothetical protein